MVYTEESNKSREIIYRAELKLEKIEGDKKTRALVSIHVVSPTVDGLKNKLNNVLTVLDDDDFVK